MNPEDPSELGTLILRAEHAVVEGDRQLRTDVRALGASVRAQAGTAVLVGAISLVAIAVVTTVTRRLLAGRSASRSTSQTHRRESLLPDTAPILSGKSGTALRPMVRLAVTAALSSVMVPLAKRAGARAARLRRPSASTSAR